MSGPARNVRANGRRLIVAPAWNRLAITLSSKVFDNIFGYFLAIFGLISGLRIRLLGEGDQFVKMIDGNMLVASGILILMSGFAWKLCEFLIFLKIPFEVQDNSSVNRYLDYVKKGIFDAQHFTDSYNDHVNHWNKKNTGKDTEKTRLIVFLGLLFSIFLCVLSFLALALSSHELLSRIIFQALNSQN